MKRVVYLCLFLLIAGTVLAGGGRWLIFRIRDDALEADKNATCDKWQTDFHDSNRIDMSRLPTWCEKLDTNTTYKVLVVHTNNLVLFGVDLKDVAPAKWNNNTNLLANPDSVLVLQADDFRAALSDAGLKLVAEGKE